MQASQHAVVRRIVVCNVVRLIIVCRIEYVVRLIIVCRIEYVLVWHDIVVFDGQQIALTLGKWQPRAKCTPRHRCYCLLGLQR